MRSWFFGDVEHQSLETRLFFMFSSFVMLSAAGAFAVNAAIESPPVEFVYCIVAGALALVFHVIGKRLQKPEKLVPLLQALTVGVLCVAWFSNNGLHGSVPFFFFPLLVMSSIMAKGTVRVLTLGGIASVFFALVLVQRTQPSLVQGYASDAQLFHDVAAVLAVTFLVCCTLAITLAKAYAEERERVIQLTEEATRSRVEAQRLERELATMREILPICSSCKKIRDQVGDWHAIEQFLSDATGTKYSHGLCEPCFESLYGENPT